MIVKFVCEIIVRNIEITILNVGDKMVEEMERKPNGTKQTHMKKFMITQMRFDNAESFEIP